MTQVVRLRSGVSIREFRQRLAKLPLSVSHAIAQQAAPILTQFVQAANSAQANVYGDPYPPGRVWEWQKSGERPEQTRDERGRITGNVSVAGGEWFVRAGGPVDLVRTGDTRRALRFVVNGTIVRASLGPRYARYLIGKYKILPIGDRTAMPASWTRALDELARTVIERPNLVAA